MLIALLLAMDSISEESSSAVRSVLLDGAFQNLKILDQMMGVIEEQDRIFSEHEQACRSTFPSGHSIFKSIYDQKNALAGVMTSLRQMFDTLAEPMIRPLQITDLPDEILVQIFEQARGWEVEDMNSMVIANPRSADASEAGSVVTDDESSLDMNNNEGSTYRYDIEARKFQEGIRNIERIRLTCRKFCEISSHLLIPSLYVEMQPDSLARLEEIAQHPTIGPGVRTVRALLHYYDATQAEDLSSFGMYGYAMVESKLASLRNEMPTNMTAKHWQTLLDTGEAAELAFHSISHEEESSEAVLDEQKSKYQSLLRRAHEEYRSRFEAQEALRSEGNFSRRVAAAMARLPVARRLEFHDIRYCERESFQIEKVEDDDHIFQMLLQPTEWYLGRSNEQVGLPIEIIPELPVYIHRAGIQLATLTIEIPINRYAGLLEGNIDTTELSAAMQGLKFFKYRPKLDREWMESETTDFKPLVLFLHSVLDTASIRKIALDHHMIFPRALSEFDVGPVMTFRQWPNLESVSLTRTAFHLKDLQSFLQTASPVLQEQRLKFVYLLSGTWAEALDALRAADVPVISLWSPRDPEGDALQHDSDVFIPDSDGVYPVNRYISRATGQNPIRAFEQNASPL